MDPISLVLRALASGAAQEAGGSDAVRSSYAKLTQLVNAKFSSNKAAGLSFTERALASEPYQASLAEELATCGVATDQLIIGVARELLALLDEPEAAQGKYQIDMQDTHAVQVGDYNQQFNTFYTAAHGTGSENLVGENACGVTEVKVYLAALVRWLNSDPWPEGTQPATRMLTPAAIERKLKIKDREGETLDADDLAARCDRLIVLGGPGSGKTWQAKRAARLCAEKALGQLAAGATLGEVELPLYTTCARLAAAPARHSIRRAVVASALGHLPDLGGSRVTDALRVMFEERDDEPMLLVMDSLDETRGADDRLRQADTLPAVWRILLTSRPGAWNGQIAVNEYSPLQQTGTLQPLQYPQDVESFVYAWFSSRQAWAASLAAQLRSRSALQEAAAVPLLLTFYCILGGNQPLPDRRAELYAQVIRRMLTGRWRGSSNWDPEWDPAACMDTLRGWAWSAAASDPLSGLGDWADEFPAPRVRNSGDRDALDHVAVPLGPPDLDTGMTRRQFVHRSVQEHLVAEYVALRMPAEEAADELVNHLWYDPDWEHAAPAALAMHPQREQVLKGLIFRMGAGQLNADITVIDGCWEVRRFLARVALESSEGDWSPEAAQLIGQARTDLATSRLQDLRLIAAGNWPTSNLTILRWLIPRIFSTGYPSVAESMADAVTRLARDPDQRAAIRQALLRFLTREDTPWTDAIKSAKMIARLDPSEQEQAAARQALFDLLHAREEDTTAVWHLAETIAGLDPSQQEQAAARQALLAIIARAADAGDTWTVKYLADTLAGLSPSEQEQSAARQALLPFLSRESDFIEGEMLIKTIAVLAVTPEARAAARQALLAAFVSGSNAPETDGVLAHAVAELAVSPEERAAARQALLDILTREEDSRTALNLTSAIAGLDPSEQQQTAARQALLDILTREEDSRTALNLTSAIAGLDPSEQQQAAAQQALILLLARDENSTEARNLADAIKKLAVSPGERAAARQATLDLLTRADNPRTAAGLARAIAGLDPSEQQQAAARQALLHLLAQQNDSRVASQLATALATLEPSEEERATAQQVLLSFTAREQDQFAISELTNAVWFLALWEEPTTAREALLDVLTHEDNPEKATTLTAGIAVLDPSEEDQVTARQALLTLLAREKEPFTAVQLANEIIKRDPSEQDQAAARQALLTHLAHYELGDLVGLEGVIAQLGVTVADLADSRGWPCPPQAELLAAARSKSELPAWLAALPLLSVTRVAAE